MKLKTLKAEREYWTKKLSEADSKKAKEYINEKLEILNERIEGKISNKQWLEDMVISTVGIVVGSIIYDRLKK